MFHAFVNDTDECLTGSRILKYSDEVKLYLEVCDADPAASGGTLQADLDTALNWLDAWGLELAIDKCSVVHFGRSNPRCTYRAGGLPLRESSGERDLGIHISDDLRWEKQITQIYSKKSGRCPKAVPCLLVELL